MYYFTPQHHSSQSTSPRPPPHTPAPQNNNPGYGATQQPHPHNPGPHPENLGPQTPLRYQGYEQQTPAEGQAGPSHGPEPAGLPSYADAIRGDYKVQTQD